MKSKLTILCTCCNGDYMKETLKCYRENDEGVEFYIVGTDMAEKEVNYVGVDKFYKVSKCDSENYIEELLEICKEEKVDVLIPFNTLELERIYESRELFYDIGTKVLVCKTKYLSTINDKVKANKFFVQNDISTPLSFEVDCNDDVVEILEKFPQKKFAIKQRKGCGARGFKVIDRNNIDFDIHTKCLVQEYIEGSEYTVDVVAKDGHCINIAVKRNYEMKNGVAQVSTLVHNLALETYIRYVVKKCDITGNCGFDILFKNCVYYVIDVNPRLTATISLVNKGGCNMPFEGLKLLFGEEVTTKEIKCRVSVERHLCDVFY